MSPQRGTRVRLFGSLPHLSSFSLKTTHTLLLPLLDTGDDGPRQIVTELFTLALIATPINRLRSRRKGGMKDDSTWRRNALHFRGTSQTSHHIDAQNLAPTYTFLFTDMSPMNTSTRTNSFVQAAEISHSTY